MSNTKSIHRSFVSLDLPKAVQALIAFALAVVKAMTDNPSFPSPAPTLAAISAAITALQAAETETAVTKGATTARNDKKEALIVLLQQLKGYVQTVADADPENAAAIIRSAGISVRKIPAHKARVFAVLPGAVSGTADATAPVAATRASYEWQYSSDGGKTWVSAPVTLRSKTTIIGLPVGTSVLFRQRAVTKAGEGDWSQTVSMLVK